MPVRGQAGGQTRAAVTTRPPLDLRRRRLARVGALGLTALAVCVWAYSVMFQTRWHSPTRTIAGTFSDVTHSVELCDGMLTWFNMDARTDEPWLVVAFDPPRRAAIRWWAPAGETLFTIEPGPTAATTRVEVLLPLYIPIVFTIPILLFTHARIRGPIGRQQRGLCHACAYGIAAIPPDQPCPECGRRRLNLAHGHDRPAALVAAASEAASSGEAQRHG